MTDPSRLKYTRDHEWIALDGDMGTVGITDFAQQELGDIVFVELAGPGTALAASMEMGTIESVKAVSEIYAPVAGMVEAVNGQLSSKPELVNRDPYGSGWMMRLRVDNTAAVEALMDEASYQEYLKSEAAEK